MFDLNGPRTLRCAFSIAFYWMWIFLLVWDTPLSVQGDGSVNAKWLLFSVKGGFLLGAAIGLSLRFFMRRNQFIRGGGERFTLLWV